MVCWRKHNLKAPSHPSPTTNYFIEDAKALFVTEYDFSDTELHNDQV